MATMPIKQEEYIELEEVKKKVSFTTTTITNPNLIMTADEAYDLENDILFGSVLTSEE